MEQLFDAVIYEVDSRAIESFIDRRMRRDRAVGYTATEIVDPAGLAIAAVPTGIYLAGDRVHEQFLQS